MEKFKNYKRIDLIILYTAIFLLAWAFSLVRSPADPDLWHRLAVGKIFSLTGNVIYHDIFTYFPSKPVWVDHEWLSGVVFYNLGHYFGDAGLIGLKILILFAIIVLIHKTNSLFSPVRNKYKILYYFLVIFAIIPALTTVLRCQAFTYLFFALWIYVFEKVRRRQNKLIWIFPATTLFWANLHAGFLAGFGLLIFYSIGEFLNKKNFIKPLGILALCLPVTLINPYGIKYWNYLADAVPMQRYFVEEWYSFNFFGEFFDNGGIKILILLLVFSVFYKFVPLHKIKSLKEYLLTKLDWTKVSVLLGTLYMGFSHQRHLTFFAISAGMFLYKYFTVIANNTLLRTENLLIKKNILSGKKPFLIEIALVLAFIFVFFTMPAQINLKDYPVKSVEFIKINKIEGNLLVPFGWGSYALWKLYPQNLVSSDGRFEETYVIKNLYEANSINLSQNPQDWKNLLKNYHHDVILAWRETPFYSWILKEKSWKEVYKDEKSSVFVPYLISEKKWISPQKSEKYFIQTKFQNDITF